MRLNRFAGDVAAKDLPGGNGGSSRCRCLPDGSNGPNFALGPSFTFTVSAVYAVAASQAFEEIERFFSSMPQELRDLTSGARDFANDLLLRMQNFAQQTSVSTAQQWRSIARGINPDLSLAP